MTKSFFGSTVLRDTSIRVPPGRITALIGPNGAGKTTLFNVISGLIRADRGEILLDGRAITHCMPEAISTAGLLRTFQLARGFPKLTVYEHLLVYGKDQPGETLLGLMLPPRTRRTREVSLHEQALSIARRLRLDHVLDNPVTALSGGQKKLLEIGRVLMANPRIVLMDEPTAGVNPTLTAEIGQHLLALKAEGLTILLIEHDMALVRGLADHVIVMAEGRQLVEGSFSEIVENEAVQSAYLGTHHA